MSGTLSAGNRSEHIERFAGRVGRAGISFAADVCSGARRSTQDELAQFEQQFQYPLGPQDLFSISHGSEYLSFFTAMGAATLLVAEHLGTIVGTLVLVHRQLMIRESGSDESPTRCQEAHDICDLKVRPEARSSSALARLMTAAAEVIRPCQSHACYSVVMAGTSSEPAAYTGRFNIPDFAAVAEVAVLRFLTATVYGYQVPDKLDWWIDTNEI